MKKLTWCKEGSYGDNTNYRVTAAAPQPLRFKNKKGAGQKLS